MFHRSGGLSLVVSLLFVVLGCSDDKPRNPAVDAGDTGVEDSGPDQDNQGEDEGCLWSDGDASATGVLTDSAGVATVQVLERKSCIRSYRLSSTASLRDERVANPRNIAEVDDLPTTRTGNDMFDALHALALAEMRECAVDEIRDGSFNGGEPVSCGDGGCFETGRLWNYVWTRDTAYAVDLGLAALDPIRAQNSLRFKLSERRGGGDPQIIQDTGTGGSYPVSSDRVSWALGASTLLAYTDDAGFEADAYTAISNTIEHDRRIVFDPRDGLYRGEQSFLDWREQSYPAWAAQETIHVGMSKALSTNLLHYKALVVASELAAKLGLPESVRYSEWAADLKATLQTHFWLEEDGLFSTFLPSELDAAPTRRFDLLGSAFAVLFGVADEAQSSRILGAYPHYGAAAPVQWPQQQQTPIYHNRGEWPFVSAYWLKAAARGDNERVASKMVSSLMRGAALNLSNMENFEAATGAAWVDDGDASGPVVNSERQLWSVAGYLGMVHNVIFGIEATSQGLAVSPYITETIRDEIFGGSTKIVLNDFPYMGRKITVVVTLPEKASGGSYEVGEKRLNGVVFTGLLQADDLQAENVIEVVLGKSGAAATLTSRDPAEWTNIFQPRTPELVSVTDVAQKLRLEISRNGELEDVTFSVFKNGEKVATGLTNSTTEWTDETSDAAALNSPCYALEACFTSSGNCSQHSKPNCWWGPGFAHIQTLSASTLTNTGGSGSNNHGRFHYENWGDEGHKLVAAGFRPNQSGSHLLQSVFGNGAGGMDTGVTCAVKRLYVEDEADGSLVGEGALVMPHLGGWERWGESNFVNVELDAAKTYRIVIESHDDYINMSAFSHFEQYGGEGGASGAFNRVNIAELKVLFRRTP